MINKKHNTQIFEIFVYLLKSAYTYISSGKVLTPSLQTFLLMYM